MDREVSENGANHCHCKTQKNPTQLQCFISDNSMFKLPVGDLLIIISNHIVEFCFNNRNHDIQLC